MARRINLKDGLIGAKLPPTEFSERFVQALVKALTTKGYATEAYEAQHPRAPHVMERRLEIQCMTEDGIEFTLSVSGDFAVKVDGDGMKVEVSHADEASG